MRKLLIKTIFLLLPLLICTPLLAANRPLPTFKLQIKVLSAERNLPVPNARLTFLNNEDRPKELFKTEAESEGNVTVTLPKGSYQFLVATAGMGTSRNYLYLNEQPRQTVTVWLHKAATLSGRVTRSDGKGAGQFKVTLDRLFSTVTDQDGQFTFNDVDSGGHDLNLEQPGFVFDRNHYPQLVAGKQLQMGDLTVRRSAAVTVTGKIIPNRYLHSLNGVQVTLSGKTVWKMGQLGGNGRLTLNGLPPGDYTLSFADERLLRNESRITLNEGDQGAVTMEGTPAPPSLQLEMYGDTILAEKQVSLWLYGLWTEQADATIYRIPAQQVIAGKVDFSKPENLDRGRLQKLQSFKVTLKKPKNRHRHQTRFRLPPLQPGAYLLQLQNGANLAQAAFIATDLALVAKADPDNTLIQALDIRSGKPLAGVRLLGENGDFGISTDQNGLATWDRNRLGNRVVGQNGGGLAILNLPPADQEGEKTAEIKGYLYTDRTVYRPGQTVFYKGVLRRNAGDDYQLPAATVVELKINDPNDRTLFTESLTSSENGSFHGEFNIPETAALGQYSIIASSGGNRWHGSFKLLEYRKPEFEMKLVTDKRIALPGEQIPMKLSARYYFGAPVAGGKLVWRLYSQPWQRDEQAGGGFGEDFHYYGSYNEFLGEGELQLDQNGEASFNLTAATHERPLFYIIEADLSDSSNRQSSTSAKVTVVPSAIDLTLKGDQYLLKPGQQTVFTATAKSWQGEKRPLQPLSLLVERQQYDKKSQTFGWEMVTKLEGKGDADGNLRFSHSFPKAGFYRLTAEGFDSGKRRAFAETTAWVWQSGWGVESYRELEAEFDKKSYRIGETAKLIVRTPAQGGVLHFTMEGRRVHQSRIIQVSQGVQVIEIPVTGELAPNIHVSISMVANGRFYHQQGLLKVEHQPGRLDLTLKPDKQLYTPGERAKINIMAEAEGKPAKAELSLAVVDEAIFAVMPESHEEIYSFFRGRRDHLVQTIYSFPQLYLGGASKDLASLAANDDLKGIKVRKLFKDTAGWFPLLTTAENGIATAEADLPDNLTRWRATAVGHTGDSRFGTGQTSFTSRLPFMARLAVPRFMLVGDTLEIPAILNEATGEEQQVKGIFSSSNGLTLSGDASFSGALPPNGTLKKGVVVTAAKPGDATIRVSAAAAAGKDSMEVELPLLPRTLKRAEATSLSTAGGGEQAELTVPGEAVEGGGQLAIRFAPTLTDTVVPALSRLIDFPYGCTEQTIARFVPAAYAFSMLKDDPEIFPNELRKKLPGIIDQGLKQIGGMQQEDGGWGWWKNSGTDRYLTALVMQGLARGMEAGITPDSGMLERGKGALAELLKQADPEQSAFLYRAFTAYGGADLQVEQMLLSKLDLMGDNARVAVADALANRGNNSAAAEILQTMIKRLEHDSEAAWLPENDTGWQLGRSPLESSAALLSSLSRLLPDDRSVPKLARYLARNQRDGWWYNTAVSSAGVLALADFSKTAGQLDATYSARLSLNGEEIQRYRVEKGKLASGKGELVIPVKSGKNSIRLEKLEGNGTAWAAAVASWQVPLEQPLINDQLKIERSYYRIKSQNDNGVWRHIYSPIAKGETISPGEDIEVRLDVTNGKQQEYIILEDYLPAGSELRPVELDPRYAAEPFYRGWYDQQEQRDRLVAWFITRLPAGSRQFRYIIRPELKGEVTALPTAIWPMYNPQLRGEGTATRLEVR